MPYRAKCHRPWGALATVMALPSDCCSSQGFTCHCCGALRTSAAPCPRAYCSIRTPRHTTPRLSSRGRRGACFARPPWRHMPAFARPRRHLLRSSHFSLLAVLIPDKETVAHAPNTRRLPLACSEGRQCPPLQVLRCMSSVACPEGRLPVRFLLPEETSAGTLRNWMDCQSAVHISTRTGLTAAMSAGSALPHLHRHSAHPAHNCAGTGLTAATSALGLGSRL